jgi:hypothetical protein
MANDGMAGEGETLSHRYVHAVENTKMQIGFQVFGFRLFAFQVAAGRGAAER